MIRTAKQLPVGRLAGEHDRRLTELFRDQAAFVSRVLRRFGVPDADVEDAVQEVFLAVARRIDAYEERGSLRAWLVAIARQVAQHEHRNRFRHRRRAQVFEPSERTLDPERTLEQQEAIHLINSFLTELDADQAIVFYLAEIEDLTAPEIAGSLNVKLNTVYGRLRIARKRFEARVGSLAHDPQTRDMKT